MGCAVIVNVLSIAGSDPSGGAGIQADIKAISANGAYAMAAITGLTAQNTRGVSAIALMSPDFVAAQIAALRRDIRVDAIKIGMLGNADIASAVAHALDGYAGPVVVDPVMVAKGGDRLLDVGVVGALRAHILPLATVITPNLPEAADLLAEDEACNEAEMLIQARRLQQDTGASVLLKGGHLPGDRCCDLLVGEGDPIWFDTPRSPTRNTHGTGCTLSSALATFLAQGLSLDQTVKRAKDYVTGAIRSSDALSVGRGHGPTHHFHALW